ncbi:hypothetical protein DFO66_10364 [Brevibacterium sanguinis]|uniref:TetR family transcriptional regulator n=2 Tax=Brevibacterium TaxID=1696 RepID=A0A366IK35_9MICO|nr:MULTISPECIES: TetR/AcrR family transcriptional regulator [Brevibacterium]RBP66121.1 hypothetical protein DFO66_10364 [Brevibacterium sanguinis]RBP72772.1 hypothetical protein DFO65_10363 [Brevibacterium celere]
MISRRDVVTDSAIAVVAEQGVRGLTHRAVDALAGLPVGSTSNVYRTRDALITGIMERIGELNSLQLERLPHTQMSSDRSPDELAVDFCMNWLTTDRNRFYAMVMLSLDPALPTEAQAAKEKNLRNFDEYVVRVGGVSEEVARRVNCAMMGVMTRELMAGTARRENLEGYVHDVLQWMRDNTATA